MEIVVLYARSAISQEQVDRQFRMMQESLAPGVDVVVSYSDVGPGMDTQLPGLQQARACLENGQAEALIVLSVARLSRSVQELARLAWMFRIEFAEPENLD